LTARRTIVHARKIVLIAACGPLLGLVEVVGQLANYRALGVPVQLAELRWMFVGASLWGLCLPLVVRWCERDPLVPGQIKRQFPRHVARSVLASLLFGCLYGVVRWAAHRWLGSDEFTPRQVVAVLFRAWFLFLFFMYAVVLSVVSALAYQRQLREKERLAAKLETELVQTEIKLLKAELDPHFLFNALHIISALVYRDAAAAERTISRLIDFLRLSLASGGLLEVSLQQELEHLSSYMEIQMVRFRGRLTLDVDVPTELLSCRVPNLLLQPLIENVVKHAVARSNRPVRATVRARREADHLLLEILDDGPGLPAADQRAVRTGVGLTNTRGRLLKLYGATHRLTLANRPEGGTRAAVTLPLALEHGGIALSAADAPEDLPHVASSRR